MSKPRALPSPLSAGEQAGADRAAGRARRARSRRRRAPPPRRRATPPEDCITSGCGRPAACGGLAEPARGSGRAGGRGRRRSRWSSSARTRGSAAAPRARRRRGRRAARSRRCSAMRALVRWGRGRRRAGRSRPTRRRSRAAARPGAPARPRRAARRRPPARSAPPPRSAAPARPAAPASARRGGRGRGRSWRPISSRSAKPRVAISAVRAPRSSSSALVPTVIPWAKASTSPALGAGSRQHLLDRRASPRPTRRRAWSAPWRCGRRRRRSRTASVKVPPTSTPSSMSRRYASSASAPLLAADLAVGGRGRSGRRRARGRVSGKSVRRWPPRDSRRSRAQVAIAARQRVGVARQRARGRRGCASARRRRQTASRVASRRRLEAPLAAAAGARCRRSPASAAAAARPPKTKHSLSELEASRLAPCRPVQEHSPTA